MTSIPSSFPKRIPFTFPDSETSPDLSQRTETASHNVLKRTLVPDSGENVSVSRPLPMPKPALDPVSSSPAPPPAPKKYKLAERIHDPFLQNAVAIQRSRDDEGRPFFIESGTDISLEIDLDLMTGKHAFIARIAEGQPPVIEGISNETILFKTFLAECILSVSVGIGRRSVNHVISQYERLRSCNLPVAEIYNLPEAKNNCGFFLVEYIPGEFPMWDKKSPLLELDDAQLQALDEVKSLFEQAYEGRIDVDLKPSKLRLRADGQVTIIDLSQVALDDELLDAHYIDMFKTFAEPGSAIWNYLIDSPVYSNQIRNFGKEY